MIEAGRLSLNQATVKNLSVTAAAGLRKTRDHRDRTVAGPGCGCRRGRVGGRGSPGRADVSSLCRGGFSLTPTRRRAGRAGGQPLRPSRRRRARADVLVLVGGEVPGSRDIGWPAGRIADAISDLVPTAERAGVRLGIEALHPVYCSDRCVIYYLGEATDLALEFPADVVGVVVDTYRVSWDARLPAEIARARDRIFSFQLADWILPLPADVLLGRGHVGDGVIDFPAIAAAVDGPATPGWLRWRSSTSGSGTIRGHHRGDRAGPLPRHLRLGRLGRRHPSGGLVLLLAARWD